MPRSAPPPAAAPVRAAGLVLTLCATVAGAAGAATLSTAPAASHAAYPVSPAVELPAVLPVAAVPDAEVHDDAHYEELDARAGAARTELDLIRRRAHDARVAAEHAAYAERVALWDELAACETGGNWHDGGDYGGGLGIYVGTWKMYGGHEFAPRAQWATKAEQIVVAERIALDGYGGWGCAHTLGWTN